MHNTLSVKRKDYIEQDYMCFLLQWCLHTITISHISVKYINKLKQSKVVNIDIYAE